MPMVFRSLWLLAALLLAAPAVYADDNPIQERVLGKADAPITVDEYVSLTCSHCAEFYNSTLPDLEKKYVETGKVRFILHDFPLDGVALKAAALARCMPADEFYPYVKVLYKNQAAWAFIKEPEKVLIQYAKLGGLSDEKANACLKDTKLQDALIAERTDAAQKLGIEATPTFIVNKGAEIMRGAQPADAFTKVFDRLLAEKH